MPRFTDAFRVAEESGQTMAEYGVVLALVTLARGRVDAERDDETLHAALAGPGDEAVDGVQPPPVAGSRRKRQVFGAQTMRESEEVRKPAGPRVDVDGADDHLAVPGEDLLRAVALMRVDVEHGDAFEPQRNGCARRGVEVARPAVGGAAGVVARRTRAGVHDRLSSAHEVSGSERDVDRGAGGLPGALAAQRHRVVREEARLRRDRGRLDEWTAEAGVGEDVRDDAGLAWILGQPGGLPLVPGRLEEPQQVRVVDRLEDLVVVSLGQEEVGPCERVEDPVHPGW